MAAEAWEGPEGLFPNLGKALVYYADVQNRVNNVGGAGQRNDVAEPPSHPLHLLQDDATLRGELSDLSRSLFGDPLTLDHLSGTMQLRVGIPSESAPAADESQAAYRAALAALPLLSAQGDGMKSLLGLLLWIVTATYPVIIVDEPEAFLHPPQAHALGKALGKLAEQRSLQIILATHDRNLLAGLLAADAPLSVVRISRDGTVTRACQLPPDKVRQLWSDSVLKYTNVLEGLFHRLVVVAEADRDCRFYEAALDAYATSGKTSIPASDVLFVPSYGKSAMHRLASILDAVDVPVVASPDLDVLNDEATIQRLTESLHGDWATMKRDYTVATNSFRQPREAVKVSHVRDALNRLFDDLTRDKPDASYTSDVRDEALAAMRSRENPWQALKDYGMNAFDGEGALAAERLVARLDEIGVVVVRVGELEGFAPLIGAAKGSEWLAAAINAGAHTDDAAQAHIARILNRVEEVSNHLVIPKVKRRETTALTSPDR
jgi:hypothetical protein